MPKDLHRITRTLRNYPKVYQIIHFIPQGISPGLVATDLMVSYSTYSEEALAALPTLEPEDVAAAALYILSSAPKVVVSSIRIIHPLIIITINSNLNCFRKP